MIIADKHDTRLFNKNEPSLGAPEASAEGVPEQERSKESQGPPPEEDEMQRREIDRIELQRLLLVVSPKATVRWGQKVQSVLKGTDSTINVNLENGTSESYDLVIGADGA